jgi:tRNA A-37 threonylcarbamoyl transferase component Bud32
MNATAHPRPDELVAFAQGKLPPAECDAIEEHLFACPSCAGALERQPEDRLLRLARQSTADDGATVGHHASATAASPEREGIPVALARHDRYHVLRLLGQGGMGSVFRAEHRVMRRPVALKVIKRAYLDNAAAVERFRQEVRAAARLQHPNIVTAYDAEQAGDVHFLVMEYVEGQSLARILRERGPLPLATACDYARQAALGLQHAHERGMVHRDVKPDNLMLTPDGTVKVLDFGLAALTAEREGGGLTEESVFMGTPDYVAPEQAEDARQADARSDVYSLGCSLYHLLTGQVPYPAATSLLKVLAHREQPPPPLRRLRPDVPEALAAVLRRMLAKDPARRYATSGDVARALAPFAAGVTPRTGPSSQRVWLLAATLLGLFAAGGTVAGAVVFRIQRDRDEVVLETDDPEVEVVIKRGGDLVRIVDPKSKQTWELDTRKFRLGMADQPDGLKIDLPGKEPFLLRRGDKGVLTITRQPAEAARAQGKLEVLWRASWDANARVHSLGFSPDGRALVASRDYTAPGWTRTWDVETGAVRLNLKGSIAQYTPNGKYILACTLTSLRLHDAESGEVVRDFGTHASQIWSLYASRDGKRALTSTAGGTRHLWDVEAGKELRQWDTRTDPAYEFTADSKRVLVLPQGKQPTGFWDVAAEQWVPAPGLADVSGFFEASFLPDGEHVLVCTGQKLHLHDVATGKEVRQIDLGEDLGAGRGREGVVSGDGRRFLVGTTTGSIRAWDLATGAELGRVQTDLAPFQRYAFSPDGRHAAAGDDHGWVYVFRLPDAAK